MSPRRKRARKHIALRERLAAALSQLLPQEQRDQLREAKVPARQVISLFTPDHNILFALAGPDEWWNITMRIRGPELKAKDNRDTSIAAKVKRVAEQHEEFRRRVLAPTKRRVTRDNGWPKGRKLRSRNSFERRT